MNMMTNPQEFRNVVLPPEIASKIAVKTEKSRAKAAGFDYNGEQAWLYLTGPNKGREFIVKNGVVVLLPVQEKSPVVEVKDTTPMYPRTEYHGSKPYILNCEREWLAFKVWREEQETARRTAEEALVAAKAAQPKPFLSYGIWYDGLLYHPRNERELQKLHLFIEEIEKQKAAAEAKRAAWENRPGAFRQPKEIVRTVGEKTNVGAGTDKGPSGGGKQKQTSNPKKAAAIARKAAQRKK